MKNDHLKARFLTGLLLAALFAGVSLQSAGAQAERFSAYYKDHPLFHMYPDPEAPRYTLKRFGPVGIGLELRQPAFTMHITNIEPGSPAEACGKLKKGQIIDSINGQTLVDEDPRVILGNLITEAEAKDGVMKMMVKDDPKAAAREVIVRIPVLGAYSDTWPMNCRKSDRIVRNFADYLAENKDSIGIGLDGALVFMLSTGEEKDLQVARRWVAKLVEKYQDMEEIKTYPWFAGYNGPALCEYYLRTGDESVLPVIKKVADYLTRTIYNGSWMGRGGASYGYMAGGHMNAAGVHCVTFLLMAKACGVAVDEHTLQTSLQHFFRYAGHGNVAYGDGLPEGGMVDNGRVGGLAFAMNAAASLTPEGEHSVYAKARDISATKSFYSTNWLFHGHTGGGIGELWRGAAMGLVKDKRPKQYRSFMDERRWMYELARTHDGVFGWVSGWNVSYDDTAKKGRGWGNWIPLVYTLPRKQLRIFGAPATPFCKTYQLPKRPWGTAADEVFYSLEAGEYEPGKRLDVSTELLPTDSSWPIGRRLGAEDVSDETLLMYAHHIDQGIRAGTATNIVRKNRDHLIARLLKSNDPRGRHTGAHAIAGQFKGQALPPARLTDEMVASLATIINDPEEAWWTAHEAMVALGSARPAQIAPHVERLAHWLEHEDWWLRRAAMIALTPVATDKRFYAKILPIVGNMVATNERAVALSPLGGIVRELQNADPEVQAFAVKVLGKAYTDFPETLQAPGGQDMSAGVDYLLNGIAANLVGIPGGFEELYRVSRKRFPDQILPHKSLYMAADSSRFGPLVKEAFKPILREELIPAYVQNNRKNLEKELTSHQPGRTVDGLVDLYQKLGDTTYNWKLWGPARDKIEWRYVSYDPPEKKLWEKGWRYRQVSWPEGADNWFMPDFDPVKVGWKTGFAPFANQDGKLAPAGGCVGGDHFCGCGNPPNTFWEKEVLLMRTTLELPPMREGYAYRLLVGGRSHVNWGDGSDVWIDGKYKESRRKTDPSISGVGKRQGGKPWGFVIDDDFRQAFADGKITLAATGFLKIHPRSGIMGNYQTFWFEEMKLPELPPQAETAEGAK